GSHPLELRPVAADQRPAQPLRRMPGEVARGQPAGEPGGPEQGDVVLALRCHAGVILPGDWPPGQSPATPGKERVPRPTPVNDHGTADGTARETRLSGQTEKALGRDGARRHWSSPWPSSFPWLP